MGIGNLELSIEKQEQASSWCFNSSISNANGLSSYKNKSNNRQIGQIGQIRQNGHGEMPAEQGSEGKKLNNEIFSFLAETINAIETASAFAAIAKEIHLLTRR